MAWSTPCGRGDHPPPQHHPLRRGEGEENKGGPHVHDKLQPAHGKEMGARNKGEMEFRCQSQKDLLLRNHTVRDRPSPRMAPRLTGHRGGGAGRRRKASLGVDGLGARTFTPALTLFLLLWAAGLHECGVRRQCVASRFVFFILGVLGCPSGARFRACVAVYAQSNIGGTS